MVRGKEEFVSYPWAVCGALACSEWRYGATITRLVFGKREICAKDCTNLEQAQINDIDCGEKADLNMTEFKCDLTCDLKDCADESECNGYFYGVNCYQYTPIYKICKAIRDCHIPFEDYDEKDCYSESD